MTARFQSLQTFMADNKEEFEEIIVMEVTTMDSTVVQSHPKLLSDDKSDSGEWNQPQTKSVQKPSDVIYQVQDSLEENIQDFSEGTPPPNK